MSRVTLYCLLIISLGFESALAQSALKVNKLYGYRHVQLKYEGDPVDVLIQSKTGEETRIKPILLYIQGALPKPLIILKKGQPMDIFPFTGIGLLEDYHIAIIGKPYTPLEGDYKALARNRFAFNDPETGTIDTKYVARNYVEYYVNRNLDVLKQLSSLDWVSNDKLVVAGHAEGGHVAINMAAKSDAIANVILSNSNPMGQIINDIAEWRAINAEEKHVEANFETWQKVVADPSNTIVNEKESSNQSIYTFSQPYLDIMRELKVPVLVTYGSRDKSVQFQDYARIDMIRSNKSHVDFKCYPDVEQNYLTLDAYGGIDTEAGGKWNQVVRHWAVWLKSVSISQ